MNENKNSAEILLKAVSDRLEQMDRLKREIRLLQEKLHRNRAASRKQAEEMEQIFTFLTTWYGSANATDDDDWSWELHVPLGCTLQPRDMYRLSVDEKDGVRVFRVTKQRRVQDESDR